MSPLEFSLLSMLWLVGAIAGVFTGAMYRELSAVLGALLGLGVGVVCIVCAIFAIAVLPELSLVWILVGAVGTVLGTVMLTRKIRVRRLDDG